VGQPDRSIQNRKNQKRKRTTQQWGAKKLNT
jgi:hypothetical protein